LSTHSRICRRYFSKRLLYERVQEEGVEKAHAFTKEGKNCGAKRKKRRKEYRARKARTEGGGSRVERSKDWRESRRERQCAEVQKTKKTAHWFKKEKDYAARSARGGGRRPIRRQGKLE